MPQNKLVDHLFRHQYGKMVSILTRVFGLAHLETIEDAVQDTFITAMRVWPANMPENPEAWLTQASKNRALDLFRKIGAEHKRAPQLETGPSTIALTELFLENEIADSQLRMIFAACNPLLNPKDQIAFALKTISGFSQKEIAASLLLKEETIKKRLSRARSVISSSGISFEIPSGNDLPNRLNRVLEVIYLIFNDGFHSTKKDALVREDLCGEALRLCQMLLGNKLTQHPNTQALLALMCFQAARLKSKVNSENELISLKDQDRSKWYAPLMSMGHIAMTRAVETENFSSYHYEAAIAAEHTSARDYESTDWAKILMWYERLEEVQPSPFNMLNRAVIHLQIKEYEKARNLLEKVNVQALEQRAYLYHGLWAEYFYKIQDMSKAVNEVDKAIALVSNTSEREFLLLKKKKYKSP